MLRKTKALRKDIKLDSLILAEPHLCRAFGLLHTYWCNYCQISTNVSSNKSKRLQNKSSISCCYYKEAEIEINPKKLNQLKRIAQSAVAAQKAGKLKKIPLFDQIKAKYKTVRKDFSNANSSAAEAAAASKQLIDLNDDFDDPLFLPQSHFLHEIKMHIEKNINNAKTLVADSNVAPKSSTSKSNITYSPFVSYLFSTERDECKTTENVENNQTNRKPDYMPKSAHEILEARSAKLKPIVSVKVYATEAEKRKARRETEVDIIHKLMKQSMQRRQNNPNYTF